MALVHTTNAGAARISATGVRGAAAVEAVLSLSVLFLPFLAIVWLSGVQRAQSTVHAAARHAAFHDGRKRNEVDEQPDYVYRTPAAKAERPRPHQRPGGKHKDKQGDQAETAPTVTRRVLRDSHFDAEADVVVDGSHDTSWVWAYEDEKGHGTADEIMRTTPLAHVFWANNASTRSFNDYAQGRVQYDEARVRLRKDALRGPFPAGVTLESRVRVVSYTAPSTATPPEPWWEPLTDVADTLALWIEAAWAGFRAALPGYMRNAVDAAVGRPTAFVGRFLRAWFPTDLGSSWFK